MPTINQLVRKGRITPEEKSNHALFIAARNAAVFVSR